MSPLPYIRPECAEGPEIICKVHATFQKQGNVEKMWESVLDGTIDVIGSDHGPFTDEER